MPSAWRFQRLLWGRALQFVEAVGRGILPSWQGIAADRRRQPFTEEQRQWQLLRRGRYLEFNLLYDRGVRFGLDGGEPPCLSAHSGVFGAKRKREDGK